MAHKVIDRCKETTSTTGTGNLTLTGAASGFVTMASALTSNGDTSWFCAENGSEWEVFLGTRVSATELARTTLLASSTGSMISFTNPPIVFSTVPAVQFAPPVFSAYRSGDQPGVTDSTYVKVQLNAEEFDTAGCFDSATNFRHTPTTPGYYRYEWMIYSFGSSLSAGHSQLWKNGSSCKSGTWAAPTQNSSLSGGCATIYMNGTDYVELFGYTTAFSGNKFNPGSDSTYLSGSYIGP